MAIAILGGRFDPPHLGHWWIAKQALDKRSDIEALWLVPAAQHQWKSIMASGEDRLTMLGFFHHPQIIVSDLEIARGGISYSIDTIKELRKRTGKTIYWIVGSDIINEFSRWEKANELISLATFLVFPRDPYTLPPTLPKGFETIEGKDLVVTNLSSTIIRNNLKMGRSITGFVSEGVERYITKRKLYR